MSGGDVRRIYLCGLLWVTAGSAALGADEAVVYGRAAGPHVVESETTLQLRDARREKDLTVRLHFPQTAALPAEERLPVIVFSHGFGANQDAFASISRHWASYGYVCLHPRHADAARLGGDDAAQQGAQESDAAEPESDEASPAGQRGGRLRDRLGAGGGLGAGIRMGLNSPEKLADRVADVTYILDSLDEVEQKVPALQGRLDRERIGVAGHSYGACVSMLIGGVTVEVDGQPKSYRDPRVRCVIPISAAGTGEYGLKSTSWASLQTPALFITGTRDIRPGHPPEWRREPYLGAAAGGKYLLSLEGATHFSFGGGPAGGRLAGRANSTSLGAFTEMVQTSTVTFWDAYLRALPAAQEALTGEPGLRQHVGTRGEWLVR